MNMPILTQFQNAEQSIVIDGAVIHQDQYSRFCLNDLHKASGSAQKDQPRYFLENKQTQALIQALIDSGIPLSPVEIIRGGTNQGTYVVKQIVYAYAMWISANFHLKVINTFDALVTQKPVELSRMELIQLALQAEQENQALRGQVAILEPKATALDQIADTSSSFCIRDAAKTVGVSEKKFIQFLLDQNWVYRSKDGYNTLVAYGKRIQQKVMTEKVTRVIETSKGAQVFTQARITSKGLTRLAAMVRQAGLVEGVAA